MKFNKYVVVHTEEWLLDELGEGEEPLGDVRLTVYTAVPDDGRFHYGLASRHWGRGDAGWEQEHIKGNKFFQLDASTLAEAIVEVRTKIQE